MGGAQNARRIRAWCVPMSVRTQVRTPPCPLAIDFLARWCLLVVAAWSRLRFAHRSARAGRSCGELRAEHQSRCLRMTRTCRVTRLSLTIDHPVVHTKLHTPCMRPEHRTVGHESEWTFSHRKRSIHGHRGGRYPTDHTPARPRACLSALPFLSLSCSRPPDVLRRDEDGKGERNRCGRWRFVTV